MVVRSPRALALGVYQEWAEQFRETVDRSTVSVAVQRWHIVLDCAMLPVESRS